LIDTAIPILIVFFESTETDWVVTVIATFHTISMTGTTIDAIDFVSETFIHAVGNIRDGTISDAFHGIVSTDVFAFFGKINRGTSWIDILTPSGKSYFRFR